MCELYNSTLERINSSNLLEKKLFPIVPTYFAKVYALKYDGTSHFGWHYDSTSENEFRAIFTVSKSEPSHTFGFCDKLGERHMLSLNEGDGVLVRGSETFHGVEPPSKELREGEKVHRHVIVFTYTLIENDVRQYVDSSDRFHHISKPNK